MPLDLTFNQLVIPLVLVSAVAVVLVVFLGKVASVNYRQAQEKRLKDLNPPQKGRNHKSLPPKQYYLTRNMAKPTAEEEDLLEVYVKLQAEAAQTVSKG